jgi:hypothetical protein
MKRPIAGLSSLSLDVEISSGAVASQCNVDCDQLMHQAHEELYKLAFVETPYGAPLEKHVLRIGETALELYVLDLRANLFLLCDECPEFASLRYANTSNGVADIIMYMDEFAPGNQLRPDKGRCVQAGCCNLFPFPMWFLLDSATWFSLVYVASRNMADTGLSAAHLLRELLECVLSLSVAPGSCDLRYKYNGGRVCLRLRFRTLLADCKSLFHFAGSRGAAGITPRRVCANLQEVSRRWVK